MSHRSLAVGVLALALGLAGCAHENDGRSGGHEDGAGTAGDVRAGEATDAAVAWLEGQLADGLLVNDQFGTPDYGGTVDGIYALRMVGGHDETAEEMTAAVTAAGKEYVAPGKDVYAGNAGKLVSLAVDTGGDPSDVEGYDPLAVLEDRTEDTTGRTSDKSEFGDFANSLGQAWAVRGLTEAGSTEATAAEEFLLTQQCDAGFFRQDFAKPKAKDQTCDGSGGEPSTDATAIAVIVLHELSEDDSALRDSLDRAVGWLLDEQAEDGSYVGSSRLPTNANSTGLAGWALQLAGEEDAAAAAAAWVAAHQVPEGCDGGLAEDAGAIAYDDAALTAAGAKGLTKKTSYQWRLATAQALPALLATPDDAVAAACPTEG